jgi:hypothetical protein
MKQEENAPDENGLVISVSDAGISSSKINIDSEKDLIDDEEGDVTRNDLKFERDTRFEAEEIKKAFTHQEFASIPIQSSSKMQKAGATTVGVSI